MTELIIKKSRFVAYAANVKTEIDAKAHIAKVAKEHKRARHVAYAYSVDGTEKYSDDGEPGGTAGLPAMTAIRMRGLDGVAVAVARHFGGILLGKGGLIRAYGKAAGRELDRLSGEK